MSRAHRHPAYRHWKAEPALSVHRGNLGLYAEQRAADQAERASFLLAEKIIATVGCEAPVEQRSLSFEQQLALVEQGRARIVAVPRIPSRSYEGGVGSAAALMAECG